VPTDTLDKLAEARESGYYSGLAGLEKILAFQVYGHLMHSLHWQDMSPDGGGRPEGELAGAIEEHFGSFETFQAQLTAATVGVQGSGWGVLSFEPASQRLLVGQVNDHYGNITPGSVPLLAFDAWEHAYYLQYRNARADYVAAMWNVVNWQDVAARYYRIPIGDADDIETNRPATGAALGQDHASMYRRFQGVGAMAAVDPLPNIGTRFDDCQAAGWVVQLMRPTVNLQRSPSGVYLTQPVNAMAEAMLTTAPEPLLTTIGYVLEEADRLIANAGYPAAACSILEQTAWEAISELRAVFNRDRELILGSDDWDRAMPGL